MPTYDLATVLETHLDTLLKADAALVAIIGTNTSTGYPWSGQPQVYARVAPQQGLPGPPTEWAAPPPFVVWQAQSDLTTLDAVGAHRVWGDGLYVVRTIGRWDALDAIRRAAQRVYVVLHGSRSMSGEGRVVEWVHSAELPPTDRREADNVIWHTRGHLFRTIAQPV